MTDKPTKIILAILAAGIWLNAATALIRPAMAQDAYWSQIASALSSIASGDCSNKKLC